MPLGDLREARTHFELHRAIQNVIERVKEFPRIHFSRSEPEYGILGNGFADLVVFDRDNFPWITIETKATTKAGDPYRPSVIKQSLDYASALGANYFATCDGKTFVMFDNKERGVPFWQRKRLPPYDLSGRSLESFAETLLRDIIRLEDGEAKWTGIDGAFVFRLKFLHDRFVPYLERAIHRHARGDPSFRGRLEKWLEEQGTEPSDATTHKIAIESAYLLINRILFYKVLEAQYPNLPRLRKLSNPGDLHASLARIFERVTEDIDYEAVYEPSLYSEVPLPPELAEIVNEFLDEASSYDLSTVQSDVLGRIYEGLIPPRERKDLGQYYTPPPICDLLVRMAIQSTKDTVLDPGCGSGGFLVKAYYRLLQLSGKAEPDAATHKRILSQLFGVDISQFPAHLSVINLALRDIASHLMASEVVNVYPEDFFRVGPRQSRLSDRPVIALDRERRTGRNLPIVDAVVCNPPYTRQDDIGDKKYRDEVREVALTFNGKEVDISREAGIYAYFFTHATHFLREGGRMGFIVSNGWMDANYGRSLRAFFLDRFKVRSILEFDRRAFEDAAINTVDIVLEKMSGEAHREERDSNLVRFVRVKRSVPTERIIERVDTAVRSAENADFKIMLVKQGDLRDEPGWSRFLRAPKAYFDLLGSPHVVPLSELADTNVGVITYANDFFILPRREARGHWGIEARYIRPIITSPREIHGLDLQEREVQRVVLYANKPKDELADTQALRYIEWGEGIKVEITRGGSKGTSVKGYHRTPSLHGRSLWYSIGERTAAPILFPRLHGDRLFVVRNDAEALCDHQFYEIRPHDGGWTDPLLGCLNSTPGRLAIEASGRTSLGEGVMELMKGEINQIPVVNLRQASPETVQKIGACFRDLVSAVRGSDAETVRARQADLDKVVYTSLGVSKGDRPAFADGLQELTSLRTKRTQVEVLVEHPERRTPKPSRPKRRKLTDFTPKERRLEEFT